MGHRGTPQTEIAARIHAARRWQDMGMRELSRRTGISAATISRLEAGKGSCMIQHAVPIADALGVSLDFLLRGKDIDGRARRLSATAAAGLQREADAVFAAKTVAIARRR